MKLIVSGAKAVTSSTVVVVKPRTSRITASSSSSSFMFNKRLGFRSKIQSYSNSRFLVDLFPGFNKIQEPLYIFKVQ
jgi:hypothetical protein